MSEEFKFTVSQSGMIENLIRGYCDLINIAMKLCENGDIDEIAAWHDRHMPFGGMSDISVMFKNLGIANRDYLNGSNAQVQAFFDLYSQPQNKEGFDRIDAKIEKCRKRLWAIIGEDDDAEGMNNMERIDLDNVPSELLAQVRNDVSCTVEPDPNSGLPAEEYYQ